MFRQAIAAAVCAMSFVAGAAAPADAWPDRAFNYDPALVMVSRDDLFRLHPELLRKLQDPAVQAQPPSQRLQQLLALIFGADLRGFGYVAGRSTTASETWELKQGDCLSLTVLTYAAARALNMPVQMQEVPVPAIFDRRGALDVVNQHVNVLFLRARRDLLEDSQARDVVVDFEPEFASGRRGLALSEDAIVARFYNNLAVEHLVNGHKELAYAHFKAAIIADPRFGSPYGNLAVLYRDAGLRRDAEQLLRRAVALGQPGDVPLRALHQLLVEQGRDAEARPYAQLLQARRNQDPYHWIGLGLRHLQDGDARRAITALEHAKSIAAGFPEVHRHLAVAYARAGDPVKANEELTLLASLGADAGKLSALRNKLNSGASDARP